MIQGKAVTPPGRLLAVQGLIFLGFAYYPRFGLGLLAQGLYAGDTIASYLGLVLVSVLALVYFAKSWSENSLGRFRCVVLALVAVLGLGVVGAELLAYLSGAQRFSGPVSYLAHNKVLIGVLYNLGLFAFLVAAFESEDDRFWLFRGLAFLGGASVAVHLAVHVFLRIGPVMATLDEDWIKTFLYDNHMSYEAVGFALIYAIASRGRPDRSWRVLLALGGAGLVSWMNSTRGGMLAVAVLAGVWCFMHLRLSMRAMIAAPGLLALLLWGQSEWQSLRFLDVRAPSSFNCKLLDDHITSDEARSVYYRVGALAVSMETFRKSSWMGVGGYEALGQKFCGVGLHMSLPLLIVSYGVLGVLFLSFIWVFPLFSRGDPAHVLSFAGIFLVSLFDNQVLWWFSVVSAGAFLGGTFRVATPALNLLRGKWGRQRYEAI
jgi:hypothetical protein